MGDFTPSKQPAGCSLLEVHIGALPRTPLKELFEKKFLKDLQKLSRCFEKSKKFCVTRYFFTIIGYL